MPTLPLQVIRVSDVEAAHAFFTQVAGLTLSSEAKEYGPGVVALEFDGLPVLLVGDTAADPEPLLAQALVVYKPGDTLGQRRSDLDAETARLAALGYTAVARRQTSWGDDVLSVRGPDSYTVEFVHRPERNPAAWVDLYARGPEVLDDALAGLADDDHDLAPESGQWSIRQIVHHVVEGDDLWALPLRVALAKPGALYRQDWYTPDNAWADLLDYAHRPVASALALFRAQRAYTADLLRHLDPAAVWTNSVMYSWPGQQEPYPFSVRGIVESQAVHAYVHADAIRAIRDRRGR